MKDNELIHSWNTSQAMDSNYASTLEKMAERVSKLKSNSIQSRVKRMIYIEILAMVVVTFFICKELLSHDHHWIFVMFTIALSGINIFYFGHFLEKLESLSEMNVKESLENSIKLISELIRQIKVLTLTIFPLILLMVLYSKTTIKGEFSFKDLPSEVWWVVGGFIILFTVPTFIITCKIYLPKTYIKWKNEFQEVLNDISEGK